MQDTELTDRLAQTDILTVFVPWSQFPGDCPNVNMSPEASAADRISYVEHQRGTATFDYVVLSNECVWPDAEWYARWATAALDLCDRRGWLCIPTAWNTGAPELDWLPVLDRLHCSMARRGHPFGINIYPYYPVSLMTKNDQTQYTTYRFELIQARMECRPLWFVTELAPDGGGWPPNSGDTAAFINATMDHLDVFGVWYYGGNNPLPAWPAAIWTIEDMVTLALRVNR